jgi:hypothetical protein
VRWGDDGLFNDTNRLAYIDDGTKIGISIDEVDVPYSKQQSCLMNITLT